MLFRTAFLAFNWFGAFPIAYDQSGRRFAASRRGLFIAFAHLLVTAGSIRAHLTELYSGTVKKTDAVSAVAQVAIGFGLLFVLLRRIAFVRDTVGCYNGLAADWPADIVVPRSSVIVLCASAATAMFEFVGDNVDRYSPEGCIYRWRGVSTKI